MSKKELMKLIYQLEHKAGKSSGLAEENAAIGGMNSLLANYHGGKSKAYLEAATLLRHIEFEMEDF